MTNFRQKFIDTNYVRVSLNTKSYENLCISFRFTFAKKCLSYKDRQKDIFVKLSNHAQDIPKRGNSSKLQIWIFSEERFSSYFRAKKLKPAEQSRLEKCSYINQINVYFYWNILYKNFFSVPCSRSWDLSTPKIWKSIATTPPDE